MSLRALPKDLCTVSHRHALCPPRRVGATGTGGQPNISGLLAIAQRQIAQKRRFRHWRHARQLSLCISDAEINLKFERFFAQEQVQASHKEAANTKTPGKQELIIFIAHLVAIRQELAQFNDPVGVVRLSALIFKVAARIRARKINTNHDKPSMIA